VFGSDDVIGTEFSSKFLLMRMLCNGNDGALATESAQCSNSEKPKSARTKDNNCFAFGDIGSKRAVHGACSWFDDDGGFIGPVSRHWV
jgi:hypothetical protein